MLLACGLVSVLAGLAVSIWGEEPTKSNFWLVDRVNLRLSTVGPIHPDAIELPPHLLSEKFVPYDPHEKVLKGVWVQTEVWKRVKRVNVPVIAQGVGEIDAMPGVWRESSDPGLGMLLAGLRPPMVTLVVIEEGKPPPYKGYMFCERDGIVVGGYFREAADGIYQRSPQTKVWVKHLPELVAAIESEIGFGVQK